MSLVIPRPSAYLAKRFTAYTRQDARLDHPRQPGGASLERAGGDDRRRLRPFRAQLGTP